MSHPVASIDENINNIDWKLQTHGTKRHYWYSVNDMIVISQYLRSRHLRYMVSENQDDIHLIDVYDPYSAYRLNNDRIFIAEPYSIENLEMNMMDDLGRTYIEWTSFPSQFIFLIIAHSHWRVVQIMFKQNEIDILWDDPYGGERFPQVIKDKVMNILYAAFIHFFNLDVVINQITKPIDQQGLGYNGWDCGPIAIQNVEDYLTHSDESNNNFNNYTIANHESHRDVDLILAIRKKHIIIALGDNYDGQDIVFEKVSDNNYPNPSNLSTEAEEKDDNINKINNITKQVVKMSPGISVLLIMQDYPCMQNSLR